MFRKGTFLNHIHRRSKRNGFLNESARFLSTIAPVRKRSFLNRRNGNKHWRLRRGSTSADFSLTTDRDDGPACIRMRGLRCYSMSMNDGIREAMRRELAQSKCSFNLGVGLACFFVLTLLATIIPGLAALIKEHDWPAWVILVICIGAGWFPKRGAHLVAVWKELDRMDDDALKYHHDRISRKNQKYSLIFCLIVALVVAYFIFRK